MGEEIRIFIALKCNSSKALRPFMSVSQICILITEGGEDDNHGTEEILAHYAAARGLLLGRVYEIT